MNICKTKLHWPVLYFLSLKIFTLGSSGGMNFNISLESIPESQLKFLNSFNDCLLHLINYRQYDIDFLVFTTPIVLVYYDSPLNILFLLDTKLLGHERDILNNYYVRRNYTFMIPQELNKRLLKSGKFTRQLFQHNFKISSKKTYCEFLIYLHPPNSDVSPNLYVRALWSMPTGILKDPFWVGTDYRRRDTSFLTTSPKISLLICKQDVGSTCENVYHKNKWISTVIGDSYVVRLTELVLILEKVRNVDHFSMLCSYCNPCNPFQMVDVEFNEIRLNKLLDLHTIFTKASYPQIVTVEFSYNNPKYFEKGSVRNENTRKALLNYLTKFDVKMNSTFLPFSFDIHMIQLLIPENITMHYLFDDHDYYYWKSISVTGCTNKIPYPGTLRPLLRRHTKTHLGHYRETSLVFQRKKLLFVSCHKQSSHMIVRLNELVFAFDTLTWLMILLILGTVAGLLGLPSTNPYQSTSKNIWNTCFALVSTMMEQSTNLYQNISGSQRILLFWLPVLFLALSNEYKGENITNLTVEPKLEPFDTFDRLVENKFDIRSRRHLLDQYTRSYFMRNSNNRTNFTQESKHEAYPIVSEFWFQIMKLFSRGDLRRIAAMTNMFSNKTQYYLNHSEMLPEWKTQSGDYGWQESTEKLLDMHMSKCNKSAMILLEPSAIQLFATLKSAEKPVYFGKDVIMETFSGYTYLGHFPQSVLLRLRYSVNMGVITWWQNYINWFLLLKTHNDYGKESNLNRTITAEDSSSGVYILSLIPGFGLILSLGVFIIYDCNAIIVIPCWLWKVLRNAYGSKFWRKRIP